MTEGVKGFQKLDNNPMWKGDDVGYFSLHEWIKNQLEKPESCSHCNKEVKLDLVNLSGNYSRDLTDWIYLCRSCHMKYDFIMGFRIFKRSVIRNRDKNGRYC